MAASCTARRGVVEQRTCTALRSSAGLAWPRRSRLGREHIQVREATTARGGGIEAGAIAPLDPGTLIVCSRSSSARPRAKSSPTLWESTPPPTDAPRHAAAAGAPGAALAAARSGTAPPTAEVAAALASIAAPGGAALAGAIAIPSSPTSSRRGAARPRRLLKADPFHERALARRRSSSANPAVTGQVPPGPLPAPRPLAFVPHVDALRG